MTTGRRTFDAKLVLSDLRLLSPNERRAALEAMRSLEANPEVDGRIKRQAPPPLRRDVTWALHGALVIVYRLKPDELEILRVQRRALDVDE